MITVAVGTEKGAFFLQSRDDRRTWSLAEPAFRGWRVTAFEQSPGGDYLLTTGSNWFGAAVHRSPDLTTWEQIVDGPAWPESTERKLTQIWTMTTHGDTVFAGVDEAGLFRSDDDATTWQPVNGLNEHTSRPGWGPGLGGLCAHHVLVDPLDPARMWVGISAVGVFRTDDGGRTWHPKNNSVEQAAANEDWDDVGWCVHGITLDPAGPDLLWRQEHTGVFRSADGGETWERIEDGLPASFGFPIVRDHRSGSVFVVPLESDEFRLPVDGKLRVYQSRNGGASWEVAGSGLPDDTFSGVLRGAMTADQLDPAGVYVGTTGGAVYATRDLGDTWQRLPGTFPRISSVRVFVD
jgi:photosystem II stability/assembly factor-like uncharacterized protein